MEVSARKVLCVGLCCLDIVMVCESYPAEDSDQRCISHQWQRGGNASNSATVFAEFGIPCEILGTLSHDIGGQFMKTNFEEHNICTENCHFYDEYESPVSTIWINNENGSRTIVHSSKMAEVNFDDFKVLDLKMYEWIHFECRPYYEDMKTNIQHIRSWNEAEKKNWIKVSIEVEKPNPTLVEVLGLGDVVFISKDFASACGFNDMTTAVQALSDHLMPEALLVCAWGEKGACAKRRNGPVCISKAYSPTKVINTLGAGDTFVAATIISLMKGKSDKVSLEIGCKVAGTKCGMHNTKGLADLCPYVREM